MGNFVCGGMWCWRCGGSATSGSSRWFLLLEFVTCHLPFRDFWMRARVREIEIFGLKHVSNLRAWRSVSVRVY